MASRQPRTSFAKKASDFDRLHNLLGGNQLAPEWPKRSGGIATLGVDSIIEALPQNRLEPRRRDAVLVVSAVAHELDDLVHKAGRERCVGEFARA